jgi:alkylhydroperoxidase family enzyme
MAQDLASIEWESCLLEPHPDPALQAHARRRWGMVPPAVPYFASVPWVARTVIDLHPEFGLLMHLEQQFCDIVTLVVSQENSCRFCYASTRSMLWLQGMDRERIRRIERDSSRADLPPRLREAIGYGRSQSRDGPTGARTAWQSLRRSGFAPDELKELAFVVAMTDFANRVHTLAAIPSRPMEHKPEQWLTQLLRPFIWRMLRRHHSRGQRVPAPPPAAYPYAPLVAAYAGTPIAPALAQVLQQMWDSPTLTRRCKLLIFAVVARGLPCAVCEAELSVLLDELGVPREALAQALSHLDAPELTPIERLLLPFVRETIWYEPAVLQRRARALSKALEPPEFIEAIGVASLANGLCRMAATVCEDPA